MRKVIQEIEVYNFSELEKKVQDKITENYVNVIIESVNFEELDVHTNAYKAWKKSQDMRTPWFLGSYYLEYCYDEIIADLSDREYTKYGCEYDEKELHDFLRDEEKMCDFPNMTKEEFLKSYSYLTEYEYNITRNLLKLKGFIIGTGNDETAFIDEYQAIRKLGIYDYEDMKNYYLNNLSN